MNFSLTPNLEQFVRDCAASGDYNNASEVVREALRLFKRVEEQRAIKLAHLRQAIDAGDEAIGRGEAADIATQTELDTFFAKL